MEKIKLITCILPHK